MSNSKTNQDCVSLEDWSQMIEYNTPYNGFIDGGEDIGIFYCHTESRIERYTEHPNEPDNIYSIYYHNVKYDYHLLPVEGYTNANPSIPFSYQIQNKLTLLGLDTVDVNTIDSSHWTDFGQGIRGPVTIGSVAPIVPKDSKLAKAIWKESRIVGKAKKTTSVASLTLRRALHNVKPWKILPKATSLGGQLGRAAGRVLMPIGILLTIYDVYVFLDRPMSEIRKDMHEKSLSTTGVIYPSVKKDD